MYYMSVQNNQSYPNGMKRNHSNSYVSTPQNGMKKSRSHSNISNSSDTPISNIKMNLINPNQTIRIEDKRNISDISFENFYNYCKINNIDEEIFVDVQLIFYKITNILMYHKFVDLSYTIKKCILMASFSLTFQQDTIFKFFDVTNDELTIINDIKNVTATNKEMWKFIAKDMYLTSTISTRSIFKHIENYDDNTDIKNILETYCNHIINNQDTIHNEIIKEKYDLMIKSIRNLFELIKSKEKIYRKDIQEFFD